MPKRVCAVLTLNHLKATHVADDDVAAISYADATMLQRMAKIKKLNAVLASTHY